MLLHLSDLRGQSDGRTGRGQVGGLGSHASSQLRGQDGGLGSHASSLLRGQDGGHAFSLLSLERDRSMTETRGNSVQESYKGK